MKRSSLSFWGLCKGPCGVPLVSRDSNYQNRPSSSFSFVQSKTYFFFARRDVFSRHHSCGFFPPAFIFFFFPLSSPLPQVHNWQGAFLSLHDETGDAVPPRLGESNFSSAPSKEQPPPSPPPFPKTSYKRPPAPRVGPWGKVFLFWAYKICFSFFSFFSFPPFTGEKNSSPFSLGGGGVG